MRPKRLKSNLISESTKSIKLSKQGISNKSIKASEAGKIRRKYRNNKSYKSHVKRESLKKVGVKNEPPELQDKIIANYNNEIKNEYETNGNETSQNECNANELSQQPQCSHCERYFKSVAGLRRHEISCNVTSKKSKKLERGRIRKKEVQLMGNCQTSNPVTDGSEKIKAVNGQNNRCNENPLINVSPSSLNKKKADGNKENEISESSNQTTSFTLSVVSCKAEANGNISDDVDGAVTYKDVTYSNPNAISSQTDDPHLDGLEIVDDLIVEEESKNNEVPQHKCIYCTNVYKTFRGLRRHEISCNITSKKSKKLERGRNRKKVVQPMGTCQTSKSVTDRPEEIKALNGQNNRCNENPLINVSPSSLNDKKADGNKENEISESSNQTTSFTLSVVSCKAEANGNISDDVDGAVTYKDVTYSNPNAISSQAEDPHLDGLEIVDDLIVKDESKNNEIPQHKCIYCTNVYKTFRGLRRHESNCKKKSSLNNNTASTDANTEVEIAEPSEPVANSSDSPLTNSNDNLSIDNENKCHCCGEDKETAHVIGDFECMDCLKFFRLKSSLERHIRVVHNGESHECPQCGAKSPDKGTLARHMYTHTGLKPYSCPVCKQEFSRKYHLVRHNMQTGCDGKEKPVFPCQVCGREFNRKDNLREHLRAHAGQTKRKKKYTCGCCGVECEATELLKLHKKIHNGERHYACDFCDKKFPSSGALKKHRRTHTGEKPYECITCHRWFAAKETLNRHIRLHTGYKPHCCPYCGKRFIQGTQLKAHLYYHTGQAGMPPAETFVCDLCGKKFNRKARLNEHVKFIHLGAKPFECEQCGKTFIRKEDLNRHQIIHSGIRAHQCPICSKAFTMKSSLKVHLLTHTKEPPSSCDECGRAFIRQDCLLRHMKTKHKEMLEEIKSEAEKKKLQQQLLQVAAEASLVEGMEEREELDENGLIDAVRELLTLLVDETTLRGLGWPGAGVEALLEAVIRRCGHEPAPSSTPRHDRLRHNIKLLFTVVIDDSAVKALLNNQTVDEVILHVLRLAKS